MKNTKYLLFLAVLATIGIVGGCIGMGGGRVSNDGDSLALDITTWDYEGGINLSLSGPDEPSLRTVTYFIFGSATNFGKNGLVPLQPERLDEQQFGPLVYGDKLENVDLSPWNQYDYVYLRAIGAEPNLAFRLDSGLRYEVVPR